MTWVFHDSYPTLVKAKKYAKNVISLGLANGVKIVKGGKKSKPFLLYILPVGKTKKGAK